MEYLDNLLSGELRRRVMLLIEEMPAAERVRRGNVMFKTRARDVEDTMAQLVHDDDQIIAAAAIQLVEQRQMWTLADDLEHALAHRDPHDWYVFEAASWALAAQRMPRRAAPRLVARAAAGRRARRAGCARCRCLRSRRLTSCSASRCSAARCATSRAA